MIARQKGVALLAAVLVVAIATILIAGLLDRSQIGQARALQYTRSTQAFAYQQGLELWAARLLRDSRESGGSDSRTSTWAQPMPPITVPEGMINGRMRDLDGCLNLNALLPANAAHAAESERLVRLLGVLQLDEGLVDRIVDWADEDGIAETNGAEDALYATLDPPRRTANRPFVHASELRAVAGIDADRYERLAPHLCARLATNSLVNVNTASPAVLRSLHEGIGPALAQRLYQDGRANFPDIESFKGALVEAGLPEPLLIDAGTTSRYFVAEADILLGEIHVRLYTLLERTDNRIRILARSQGRF